MKRKRYVYLVISSYNGVKYHQNEYGEWVNNTITCVFSAFGTENRAKEAIKKYEEEYGDQSDENYDHEYYIKRMEVN